MRGANDDDSGLGGAFVLRKEKPRNFSRGDGAGDTAEELGKIRHISDDSDKRRWAHLSAIDQLR